MLKLHRMSGCMLDPHTSGPFCTKFGPPCCRSLLDFTVGLETANNTVKHGYSDSLSVALWWSNMVTPVSVCKTLKAKSISYKSPQRTQN